MDLGISGRVALVAGAGRGVGRATGITLAREGASVAFVARTFEAVKEAAEEAATFGVGALPVRADLTDPAEAARAAAAVADELGDIDILVNTIGDYEMAPGAVSGPDELWEHSFNSVLMAAVRMCRVAVPGMVERRRGAIVNVAAMSVRHWIPALAHYSAQKAALAHYTKNLARELARSGVRANAVMPGWVFGPEHRALFADAVATSGKDEATFFADLNIELGEVTFSDRPGSSEEIADVIAFLVSERASYVNGAWVNVDGGSSF